LSYITTYGGKVKSEGEQQHQPQMFHTNAKSFVHIQQHLTNWDFVTANQIRGMGRYPEILRISGCLSGIPARES
jgi:hypothetical protein